MIRPIVTSPVILQIPSKKATEADRSIGEDLKETLIAHAHECVGMAANMIGAHKCIIAVQNKDDYLLMYNPEIVASSKPYETTEGCLSLSGLRSTTRYSHIQVHYFNERFQQQTKSFEGFTAQIIQHEIDHCKGILI